MRCYWFWKDEEWPIRICTTFFCVVFILSGLFKKRSVCHVGFLGPRALNFFYGSLVRVLHHYLWGRTRGKKKDRCQIFGSASCSLVEFFHFFKKLLWWWVLPSVLLSVVSNCYLLIYVLCLADFYVFSLLFWWCLIFFCCCVQ